MEVRERAFYQECCERWPGVCLPIDEYLRWIRERDADRLDVARHSELYLSCACARRDAVAIKAFDASFIRVLGASLARFGDQAFVADVLQQVRSSLLVADGGSAPKIAQYRGRGGLAQFVQVVAVRAALDLLNQDRRRQLSDDALVELPALGDHPELVAMKVRFSGDFKQAFSEAMERLDDQPRTVVRLYYIDKLTLSDLGRLYGWSAPTASRRLAEARATLLETTCQIMGARLGLCRAELDSVLRLIRSQISIEPLVEM